MDEEERCMPDDPCDHITDITGWIKRNDKQERSGTSTVSRMDTVEDETRKKFVGFGLSH